MDDGRAGRSVTARFTESGSPALESEIERLLAAATARIGREPGVEALLLGGSLGRGEGTVRSLPDGDRLASDVELYVVGRRPGLRATARQLEEEMAAIGFPDVSAAWLHPDMLAQGRGKNLSWRPSRTIRLYDLAAGSRTLLGTAPQIRTIDPADLPLAEGVRLVLNRLAEATPLIAQRSADADRWSDKILIACGDTVLLARGRYTVRYRDRATRLADLSIPWALPQGWRDELGAAYERKLGRRPGPPPALRQIADLAFATLSHAVPAAAGTTVEPLETFVPRYVTAGARRPDLLRYLPPFGPSASYEGLILVARAARAGYRPTARALRGAMFGRPLSLVLQAAALPLFLGVVRDDRSLVEVAAAGLRWGGLQPRDIERAKDGISLSRLLHRHWTVAT